MIGKVEKLEKEDPSVTAMMAAAPKPPHMSVGLYKQIVEGIVYSGQPYDAGAVRAALDAAEKTTDENNKALLASLKAPGTSGSEDPGKKPPSIVSDGISEMIMPVILGGLKISAHEFKEFVNDTRMTLKNRLSGATDAQIGDLTKIAVSSVSVLTTGGKEDRDHMANLATNAISNAWNKRSGPTVEKATLAFGDPAAKAGLMYDQRGELTTTIQERLHPDPAALTIAGQKVDSPTLLSAPAPSEFMKAWNDKDDRQLFVTGVTTIVATPTLAGIPNNPDGNNKEQKPVSIMRQRNNLNNVINNTQPAAGNTDAEFSITNPKPAIAANPAPKLAPVLP